MCFPKLLIYPFIAYGFLNAQIGIFSDVYIASGNELHLAETTFFESGNILTDRDTRSGIVSFAQGVTWNNASQASHIDGFVRAYNPTSFTFPVGGVTVFEPIQMNDFSGDEYLDVAYHQDSNMRENFVFNTRGMFSIGYSYQFSSAPLISKFHVGNYEFFLR